MSEDGKDRGGVTSNFNPQSQYQYGTFQGVANYYHPHFPQQPPPQPFVGLPHAIPPPGCAANPYVHGYQTVTGIFILVLVAFFFLIIICLWTLTVWNWVYWLLKVNWAFESLFELDVIWRFSSCRTRALEATSPTCLWTWNGMGIVS